ncbi:hypothetical protein L1987_52277 [Smallanthus sonchifolius]|uniref:Uncharacterized protein n=1 Tax=Smallanthus sonchifolius TaxID=185202 RepID=A0ACB9ET97_9ASTR|nr:hypothetical protein L1987_52277 [Smallanthus sonchifolius]
MYSNNAPPSFAPSAMNPFDQQHLQIPATVDIYSQPPSQGDMGHGQANSHNQFQGVSSYRGFGQSQTTVIVDNNKAPSLTDMVHAQGNSYNQDLNIHRELGSSSSNVSGTAGRPLSVGDMVNPRASQTSGGVDVYKDSKAAPGLSGVDPRGSSETGPKSSVVVDGPEAHELARMSLVGKNFRKLYLNAYYKDDEN